MTNILIVEDDPMVQFIHQKYLTKIGGFNTIYCADEIEQATDILAKHPIQLILLDIHLKDGNGLTFLSELRDRKQRVDVILITAANEASSVDDGLYLGALDYLIKPFTFERFQLSLDLYHQKKKRLSEKEVSQDNIDFLFQHTASDEPIEMEKGLTDATLDVIHSTIKQLPEPFTIQELANLSGLSHVSVRKYVSFLEKKQVLKSENVYLKVGRPYKAYRLM